MQFGNWVKNVSMRTFPEGFRSSSPNDMKNIETNVRIMTEVIPVKWKTQMLRAITTVGYQSYH